MKINTILAVAAIAAAAVAAPASALTYTNPGDTSAYVADWAIGSQFTNYAFSSLDNSLIGSWTVDQGPSWTTNPTAYSGLTAAALLFGGSASDYFTSTTNVSINHLAWVSTWGGTCDGQFPCGTEVAEGFVQGTPGVPEAATWAMLVAGFGLVGAGMRRRTAHTLAA